MEPVKYYTEQDSCYKLIISNFVEAKIRFLCAQSPHTEWSGILFYKASGSFTTQDLVLETLDICVLDVGTAAYTEFDVTPEISHYLTEHSEILEENFYTGLIHSHNTMATFFSGTDIATLKEMGLQQNHFLSLIVNNAGNYSARITRQIKLERKIEQLNVFNSFENALISYPTEITDVREELQSFKLEISLEYRDMYDEIAKVFTNLSQKKVIIPASNFIPKNTALKNTTVPSSDWPNTPTPTLFSWEQQEVTENNKESVDFNDEDLQFKTTLDDSPVDDMSIPINYDDFKCNEQQLKSLLLQLVTGSIIILSESKINIKDWVKNMPKFYEKRFGTGKEGMDTFDYWATSHVEFLVWYVKDPILERQLEYDDIASVYAYYLYKELTKFTKNKYIQSFMDLLSAYIR